MSRGRCQELVALLEDATRLLPLLGIAHANLVKNVEEDLSLNHLELRVLAERRLGLFDDASSSSTRLSILSPGKLSPGIRSPFIGCE